MVESAGEVSAQNVELFNCALEAINRRDLGALLRLMDNDVEAVSLLVAMEGGYHGHAGIRRWWRNLLDVFPDYTAQLADEVRELGDLTLAPLRLRGHGAGSDIPAEQAVWMVGQWRHGKVFWWRACTTEAEALETVNVMKQGPPR